MRPIVWSAACAEPRQIDVHHLGNPLVICCFELDGVLVDPGPESSHRHAAGGPRRRRRERILLTHIHFDHAGATGRARAPLARRRGVGPRARRAAPGRPQPARSPAPTRLYGDDMKRLWGEVVPVPEANLRVLQRRRDDSAPWRVEYTPGHASHHVSYLHEPTGTAFVGDVGGVRVDGGPIIAADAAARHRRRAVARVARHRRGVGARSAWPSPTSARSTTSARSSPRCTRALDRWARAGARDRRASPTRRR